MLSKQAIIPLNLYQSPSRLFIRLHSSTSRCPTLSQFPQLRIRSPFTSSSIPSQIPLLVEVEAKIFQVLKTAKPGLQKVQRDQGYAQLGFDSLDTTELIVRMEDYFEENLSDEQARNLTTVGETIDLFFRRLNSKVTNKVVIKSSSNFAPTAARK